MFNKARLKLTGWYLLIIMCVSMAFSGVIYRAATNEIERFANAQRVRFERRLLDPNFIQLVPLPTPSPVLDEELLGETEQRILMTLIFINAGILVISGALGYYLSGKTLSPIQEMLDEQCRFVSDASHELKTPITAIKTTLEVALRGKELPITEAKETLATSLEEVERLQKLAEGLLALTKSSGSIALSPSILSKVIREAVRTVQPIADHKKIKISTKIPKVVVEIEPSEMTRAIVALLDNAIKYSASGSQVNILAKIAGKVATIKIRDQGPGISEKDIPYVFDRFYRADPSRSKHGYGLGLPIAKRIIEEQKGTLNIESILSKGTTVIISLPYSAKLQESEIN
jgi:signal transduction histidine kinase